MKTINSHTLYIVAIGLLLALLMSVVGLFRYNDFRNYHDVIARESVDALSSDVTLFISERKRLVRIFGEDNLALIQALSNSPDDDKLENVLRDKALRFFPQHLSVTIADEHGNIYLEDYDGLVGEQCKRDIKEYSESKRNLPRVHPHTEAYHFDVMTVLEAADKKIILFVSFRADILATLIQTAQVQGHQLLLLLPLEKDLIEVTSSGARNVLDRQDFRLTDSEQYRMLYKNEIVGTSWVSADFYSPHLFTTQRNIILFQFSLIYIVFLIVLLFLFRNLKKEATQRKKAERHKNEFLSSVSHELRTPLTAMNGSLGLVVNGVLGNIPKQAIEALEIAQKNCVRLMNLVNDLLDIQKIEEGEMEYSMTKLRIHSALEHAIEECSQYAETYHVEFKWIKGSPESSQQDIFVKADEDRIVQVLLNLLSNAAKYGAKNDTVQIDLELDGNDVVIRIIDHGTGIPFDLKDAVFKKFTRAKKHVGSKIKGTGLGLNISKKIMDAHNGKIGYDSEVGRTCFYISLPIISE